ncbi:MAG: methyltransferase domain-containing protein [Firmicutes bacterium]|nr:methyltransferase domain-containing protein [Bacillota bacterium]
MSISSGDNVLELGCGNGVLWQINIDRIPNHVRIILSDFSEGILSNARNNLQEYNKQFHYEAVDVQNIPYTDEKFDVVIANHMLYHVPDINQALTEVNRILKPGGYFYASTIGNEHMKELDMLIKGFEPTTDFSVERYTKRFGLENGKKLLSNFFEDVSCHLYDDYLVVDNAEPIVSYFLSSPGDITSVLAGEKLDHFYHYVQEKIRIQKEMKITKSTGLFIARKGLV